MKWGTHIHNKLIWFRFSFVIPILWFRNTFLEWRKKCKSIMREKKQHRNYLRAIQNDSGNKFLYQLSIVNNIDREKKRRRNRNEAKRKKGKCKRNDPTWCRETGLAQKLWAHAIVMVRVRRHKMQFRIE